MTLPSTFLLSKLPRHCTFQPQHSPSIFGSLALCVHCHFSCSLYLFIVPPLLLPWTALHYHHITRRQSLADTGSMSYPPDTHYYSRYQHYQQASPQQTGEPVAHPSGSIRAIPVGVPLPRQVGPPPVHSPPGFHSPPGLHSPLGLPSPVSVYSDPSSFSPPALAAPISTASSIIGASPQPGLLSPLNFDVVSGPHSRPNSSYGRHYTAQTQVSPTLLPLMTTTTTAATATAQPSHGSGCYPSGYPESVSTPSETWFLSQPLDSRASAAYQTPFLTSLIGMSTPCDPL